MPSLEIVHTNFNDLEFVFQLFDHSIVYQEQRGYPVWKNYDKKAIVKDIEDKNQYKILMDGKTAIVFSVCYADEVIWREREQGDALYLHRIVVNPEFKGQKLVGKIIEWAIQHGKQKGMKFVRIDTWAENRNIIQYYEKFGFRFVENYTTPDSVELPVHNRKLKLTLLELPIA